MTHSTIEVRSTFPLTCFLDDRGPSTQNGRNYANLVSKNDGSMYLGLGIIRRDAI